MEHSFDPLLGVVQHTNVSRLFFDPRNVETIQTELRFRVHQKTGILIDRQSQKELLVIMRSIYLQNSVNQETNITEQIKRLNELVLEYSVKTVASNVLQQKQYEVDASTIPIPMSHPISTTSVSKKSFSLHPEETSQPRSQFVPKNRPIMR